MLKLMKYEFRKLRTTMIALLLALAVLELTFLLGSWLDKDNIVITSVVLLSLLAFGAYVFILINGVVSYSRELKDRTGYLVFMTPNRPIAVVLSKLLFTMVAALIVTGVFGAAAYLDYRYLISRLDIDPDILQHLQEVRSLPGLRSGE